MFVQSPQENKLKYGAIYMVEQVQIQRWLFFCFLLLELQ